MARRHGLQYTELQVAEVLGNDPADGLLQLVSTHLVQADRDRLGLLELHLLRRDADDMQNIPCDSKHGANERERGALEESSTDRSVAKCGATLLQDVDPGPRKIRPVIIPKSEVRGGAQRDEGRHSQNIQKLRTQQMDGEHRNHRLKRAVGRVLLQ